MIIKLRDRAAIDDSLEVTDIDRVTITLSSGARFELRETLPGFLTIRATDGALSLRPELSNVVSVARV